uniref:Uncharacterized protein n=2 Tax=Chromera velia CCMP2878 TaxID=1169474 RepID=A0A0G4FS97_9ALVE|eukprot:Cvel_18519.t1-p1 / transcript=Cvel_18519.t1 / gene=Cvel_18519 / organism=Chromera_velia_CCMP2878 / gene_product=hypothetical protein / transcript_product=hypothetical protein / location=Cvel_scaffold1538:38834-42888(+) / protein_length=1017 / sequence_SO=supercontig / SO=protein_coding / is_pseudo=false
MVSRENHLKNCLHSKLPLTVRVFCFQIDAFIFYLQLERRDKWLGSLALTLSLLVPFVLCSGDPVFDACTRADKEITIAPSVNVSLSVRNITEGNKCGTFEEGCGFAIVVTEEDHDHGRREYTLGVANRHGFLDREEGRSVTKKDLVLASFSHEEPKKGEERWRFQWKLPEETGESKSSDTGVIWETSIRLLGYRCLVFEQSFPSELSIRKEGLSGWRKEDTRRVAAGFPALSVPSAQSDTPLSFLSLHYRFLNLHSVGPWTPEGVLDSSKFPVGMSAGLPFFLFRPTDSGAGMTASFVVSPLESFGGTVNAIEKGENEAAELHIGPVRSAEKVPQGWKTSTLLMARNTGWNGLVDRWGEAMRGLYGKPLVPPPDDKMDFLSYWTDNGAWYYYNAGDKEKEGEGSYGDVLVSIEKHYREKVGVRLRSIQLDSWWYFQTQKNNATKGCSLWEPREAVFSHGISGALERMPEPRPQMAAHNRMFSHDTHYSKVNGGKYAFVHDEQDLIAAPEKKEKGFWSDLMTNASDSWGLKLYEQDWMCSHIDYFRPFSSDLEYTDAWLKNMADAATEKDIAVQYCMPFPRHVLASVQHKAVTSIRASDDYHPGNDQWSPLGHSAPVVAALGARPFKDVFWTSKKSYPKVYGGDSEHRPELQVAAAVLSGGPVSVGDRVGDEDAELLLSCCRADGKILRASRPAALPDYFFSLASTERGGSTAEKDCPRYAEVLIPLTLSNESMQTEMTFFGTLIMSPAKKEGGMVEALSKAAVLSAFESFSEGPKFEGAPAGPLVSAGPPPVWSNRGYESGPFEDLLQWIPLRLILRSDWPFWRENDNLSSSSSASLLRGGGSVEGGKERERTLLGKRVWISLEGEKGKVVGVSPQRVNKLKLFVGGEEDNLKMNISGVGGESLDFLYSVEPYEPFGQRERGEWKETDPKKKKKVLLVDMKISFPPIGKEEETEAEIQLWPLPVPPPSQEHLVGAFEGPLSFSFQASVLSEGRAVHYSPDSKVEREVAGAVEVVRLS